jgi:5'-nucleotidase/UDP-sugar diphosphatase
VRFDGGFTRALISGTMLAETILPSTNQFGVFPYARRTGDFLYSTARTVDRNRTYKVVVNSFATRNTANLQAYFGTTDLAFEPVPALRLKSTIAAALTV